MPSPRSTTDAVTRKAGSTLSYSEQWELEPDRETLETLVAHVLIHEVGHHFGLSDEAMHALEEQAG